MYAIAFRHQLYYDAYQIWWWSWTSTSSGTKEYCQLLLRGNTQIGQGKNIHVSISGSMTCVVTFWI